MADAITSSGTTNPYVGNNYTAGATEKNNADHHQFYQTAGRTAGKSGHEQSDVQQRDDGPDDPDGYGAVHDRHE